MSEITTPVSNFSGHDRPTWELYSTCIHCGLCLNHCPTYRVLGTEMDSPRGRIYQILQVDEGRLPLGDSFVTHIDRCLGCVACETACPSGVSYGRIVERARAQIEQSYPRPWLQRRLRNFFFQRVLRDFHLLARLARLLRWYQASGLQALARKSGVLSLLGLREKEALLPAISERFFFAEIGMLFPAEGQRRGQVAFHAGCVNHVAFAGLNHATVRLLVKNGMDVVVFDQQRCCGALSAHAGYREDARLLARRNIAALEASGQRFDAIVTNSAGCGSHMKHYFDLLSEDVEYAERAQRFAGQVRDVTEFLAAAGLRPPAHRSPEPVIYQDACHLSHGQGVRSAPRELLHFIGATVVELDHPDQCCGSAGSYNITQNELSMKVLSAKMDDIAAAPSAALLATANTGCLLQIQAGIAQRGLPLRARHIIEILNDCY